MSQHSVKSPLHGMTPERRALIEPLIDVSDPAEYNLPPFPSGSTADDPDYRTVRYHRRDGKVVVASRTRKYNKPIPQPAALIPFGENHLQPPAVHPNAFFNGTSFAVSRPVPHVWPSMLHKDVPVSVWV